MLFALGLHAQAPQGFSYQAVIRNDSSRLIVNRPVGVRVSIFGAASGTVYSERHTAQTNENGLLTLEIGGGEEQFGDFSGIAWGEDVFSLRTEYDPDGGSDYTLTIEQQLVSVPYALYAKEAGNVPAFAITQTATGYVLVMTPPGGMPQTYELRDGEDGAMGPQGPAGPQGPQGVGITSIIGPSSSGLNDTYTIVFSNGTTTQFTVTNGAAGSQGPQGPAGATGATGPQGDTGPAGPQGPQGEQGPAGATGPQGPQGEQGSQGPAGNDGRGIANILGPSVNGLAKTYTIVYTDGTTHSFTVNDGAAGTTGPQGPQGEQGPAGATGAQGPQGEQGPQGPAGNDGRGIANILGPSVNGLAKTYTIVYTDGTTNSFTVTDGASGATGPQGPQGEQGPQGLAGATGPQGVQGPAGAPGTGIASVLMTSTTGNVDTYTIHYTDNTTSTFTVTNGVDGAVGPQGPQGEQGPQGPAGEGIPQILSLNGDQLTISGGNTVTIPINSGAPGADGRGITSVAKTGTIANVDTYTITYTDNTTSTFTVTNGTNGTNGVGISGIELINTVDNVKTYRITFTDNSAYTYDVADGAQGPIGPQGEQGPAGKGIASIAKTATIGNLDTYTITYTDNTTFTFTVTNGQNGQDGVSPTVTAAPSGANVLITVVDGTGTHEYLIPTNAGTFTQAQANWAETNNTSPQYIMNKPNLATVAETGNYNDLINKPTVNDATITIKQGSTLLGTFTTNQAAAGEIEIPQTYHEYQILSQGHDTLFLTNGGFVKITWDNISNKPEFTSVAFTGDYNDLINKPTQCECLTAADVQAMINSSLGALQNKIDSMQQVIDSLGLIVDTSITHLGFYCGSSTVTDFDGNTYNTVKIGQQCWMKENLRCTHYADGTAIPFNGSESNTDPYYYDYSSSSIPLAQRGYLYNWPAAMHGAASSNTNPSNVQGVCPTGWHLPSDAEWTQLTDYVGSQSEYTCGGNSNNIGKALASTEGWINSGNDCTVGNNPAANNATGFSAVPAGGCHGPSFYDAGLTAYFWSSSENYSGYACYRCLGYFYAYVARGNRNKYDGYSVRCLRGAGLSVPTVSTDTASSIGSITATAGGEVTANGGAEVTARGVCWSTSQHPTVSDSHTEDSTGTGAFTSSLTGLTPSTTYYVRAYATNSVGTAYGEEVSFTTAELPASVGDILCTDGSWVSPDNYSVSGKTAYGVIFFLDETGEHGWAVALEDYCPHSQWGYNDIDIPDLPNKGVADTAGYSNTEIIFASDSDNVYAVWCAVNYGWYLPAIGQLLILKGALEVVNNALVTVGGTVLSSADYYWSSTEYNSSMAWACHSQAMRLNKGSLQRVRGVLSF